MPALEIGTVARAQNNREAINTLIANKITGHVSGWGIKIESIFLKAFIFSHDLNKALQNIPTARADATRTEIAAAAERNKREQEGHGAASAIKSRLDAQAEGYENIAKKTGATGEAVLAAEMAGELAIGANYTYIAGSNGIADGLTALSAAKDVLSRAPSNKPPTEKTTNE